MFHASLGPSTRPPHETRHENLNSIWIPNSSQLTLPVTPPTSFHLFCLGLGSVTVVLQSTPNILSEMSRFRLHNYLFCSWPVLFAGGSGIRSWDRGRDSASWRFLLHSFALARDLVRWSNCQNCGFFILTTALTWLIPSAWPNSFPVIPPHLVYHLTLYSLALPAPLAFQASHVALTIPFC